MHKRKRLLISIICGTAADLLLRMMTGEEGNLLVHSVVFLAGFLTAYLLLNVIIERNRS